MRVSPAAPEGRRSAADWRWAGWCLLVLGVVMTGLGLLGLRPADPHVLEVGGAHHDPMMVLCWLVTGVLELLGGAGLLLRRTPGIGQSPLRTRSAPTGRRAGLRAGWSDADLAAHADAALDR